MATLIDNVWIDGRYFGPDHGNADEVPADLVHLVPAEAWSSPPTPATPATTEVAPSQRTVVLEPGTDPDVDPAAVLNEVTPVTPPALDVAQALADCADARSKAEVVALAAQWGLVLDPSTSLVRMRALLARHLEEHHR